jgi:hypothetical protein
LAPSGPIAIKGSLPRVDLKAFEDSALCGKHGLLRRQDVR